MVESQHLQALHILADVPYEENLGIRGNKEKMLESMGFSKGTNLAAKREFMLPENGVNPLGINNYIINSLNQGRFLSMLFRNGNWESMGGAPVTYVMSGDDLNQKLNFEQGRLVKATAYDGTIVNFDQQTVLQTYARRKSITSNISGFKNYKGSIPVRLGGGFRLQVDKLSFVDSQLQMTIFGCFSFNDMGSRVLALSCAQDSLVPRYETVLTLKVDDNGQLIFPNKILNDEITTNKGVKEVIDQVLSNLFKKDGQAISNLLRNLISIRPSLGVHQLEGIFSIPSKTEISTEVIDFDGIESFDIDKQMKILSPSERLLSSQLRQTGYLLTDHDSALSHVSFINQLKSELIGISNSSEMDSQIKVELGKHFTNSYNVITEEQTGAFRLGRLLRNLDVDWKETKNPSVKIFRKGNYEITMVSIFGYDLAFWKRESIFIDCTDIRKVISELEQVVGKEILPVHISSIREGD